MLGSTYARLVRASHPTSVSTLAASAPRRSIHRRTARPHSPLTSTATSSLRQYAHGSYELAQEPSHGVPHRTFSQTHVSRAAAASHPHGELSVLVRHPTEESLRAVEAEEEDEVDVELVPLEEARLQMTERAAEQLQRIAQREKNSEAALRIAVESGGCHGYQYKMELAKEWAPDDYVFSHPTVRPSNIVVDAVSLSLLKGSLIDFATELIGSSFRVVENPQAKGSGCGCGVSWELKD